MIELGDIMSLVFYLTMLLMSSVLFWYGGLRKNKTIIYSALLIPVLIAGARSGVGTDFSNYTSLHEGMSSMRIIEYFQYSFTSIEPGFYLLIKLSDALTQSSVLMFGLSSILTIAFFYLGLRRYKLKHPALVYFLYLMILFPVTLNIVRQGIAISICFYAFTFILEKNFKKFVFWILMASLFHVSALLMLPVYFLHRLVKERRSNAYPMFLLKLAFLALAIYLAIPAGFAIVTSIPTFERYNLYKILIGEGNNHTIFLQIAVVAFGVLLARWATTSANIRLYLFLIMFAVLEIVFATIGFSSAFIKRIGMYFSIFNFMLLTEATSIFRDKAGKFSVTSLVAMYGLAYFFIAYYSLGQADIFPYKTVIAGGSL